MSSHAPRTHEPHTATPSTDGPRGDGPRTDGPRADAPGMHVPAWTDRLSGHVARHPGFWTRLGRWETRMLEDRLEDVRIERPVYVTGLARSGTTVLLELLARCPEVATHRYRDFPCVLTPWFWSRFRDHAVKRDEEPAERAHGDRIVVTAESPEAFEELVWMAFFPHAHDPRRSAVLDARAEHGEFDRFYRDHVAKMLLLRGGTRYVAKGNYNVTRLGYLRKIMPGARFVIPIRDPVTHIASLVRQHERFRAEGGRDDRIRRHLRRSGHFEFGPDRRPIHTGDDAGVEEVLTLWSEGREIEGWAAYWVLVYDHVRRAIADDPELADSAMIVRYEDLCARPAAVTGTVLAHCGLENEEVPRHAARRIRPPDYYRSPFDPSEVELIRERTREVAAAFGYAPAAGSDASASAGGSERNEASASAGARERNERNEPAAPEGARGQRDASASDPVSEPGVDLTSRPESPQRPRRTRRSKASGPGA